MGKPLAFPENRCYNYCKVIVRMMKEWGDPLFPFVAGDPEGTAGPQRKAEDMSEVKKQGGVAALVLEMARPLAQELGLSIWDVQYVKEGAEWVLRVCIDKEGGVGIDDCVDMTHALNPLLDQKDPVPQEYTLEVASPGLNRKLTRPEHLEAYTGEPVRARLIRPLEDGRRELEGLLLGAGDGQLEIQLSQEESVTLEKKELAWICAIDEVEI